MSRADAPLLAVNRQATAPSYAAESSSGSARRRASSLPPFAGQQVTQRYRSESLVGQPPSLPKLCPVRQQPAQARPCPATSCKLTSLRPPPASPINSTFSRRRRGSSPQQTLHSASHGAAVVADDAFSSGPSSSLPARRLPWLGPSSIVQPSFRSEDRDVAGKKSLKLTSLTIAEKRSGHRRTAIASRHFPDRMFTFR
ncbi:hypothetical protein AAHA92_00070 [Salvia divinorum]|uniref:Uncharacterized protein n=1 Tax=Salvia divinorum TaxID=28513 RepID=A0ABD1IIC3_SALDI